MNLEERILIQLMLKENKNISEISKKLNKTKTTITREIKQYRKPIFNNRVHNNIFFDEIKMYPHCELLNIPPYVCNACPMYKKQCSKHNLEYNA
ncbi:MAG: hypothetical protein CR959_00360 [Fusobacteriales bacterium]|nr:MAG: hypothetical protein CR959_00360 [Fusobacteriales bacterium]